MRLLVAACLVSACATPWPGGALAEPTVYAIGYHPPNFSEAYFARMDQALTEIDRHLAADGTGPVRYVRMSDLPRVFPQP